MKRHHLTCLFLTVCLLLPLTTRAAFDDLPGLRITSLGGAVVADGGDAMGFFVNPASVAWGRASALEMYYSKLYWGLEGDPLSRNAIGGYSSMYDWGAFGLGHDRFDSGLYDEQQTLVSYARLLRENLSVGVGLRFLGRYYQETPYTAVDPFFQEYGYSKGTFAVDLGAQWRLSPAWSIGLAGRRLNRPNQAIEDGAEDPLPREIQAGAVWKLKHLSLFGDVEYRDLTINGVDITPRLGAETILFDQRLALRAGANRDEVTFGFSVNFFHNSSTGSYTLPRADGSSERIKEQRDLRMRIAYTFRYPIGGISSTAGTHLVGLNVFFERDRERQGPSKALNVPLPSPPRERVVTRVDTVFVPEPKFVEVEIVDSVKIKAYEVEILGLRQEISSLENLNKALGFLEEALRLYYQKLYARAINKCNDAIREVPTLALAYIRKGSIYFAQGDYDKATEAYQKALQYDPDNQEVKDQIQAIRNLRKAGGR